MKPKDMFGLAVKILGLVFLYLGLMALPGLLANVFILTDKFDATRLVFGLLAVAWPLVLAGWLLRGAPLLMRLAYPGETPATASPGPALTTTNLLH